MPVDLGTSEQIARYALVVSAASFLVSFVSVGIAVYTARRDKAAIRATATYYSYASPTAQAKVVIRIVNVGRRPLGLQALIGLTETGDWVGWQLSKAGALILPEANHHEIVWYKTDLRTGPGSGQWLFTDLRIEDVEGTRYRVKNAKKSLRRLLGS
ncbi:MAG: hypothetical protein JSR42_12025 [Proteobacteria bacterium]|nr:hypothetical protein [Pseudomonadota bacterium]